MSFSVQQAAREAPTKTALVTGGREFSWAELAARSAGFARALTAEGVDTPVAFLATPEVDSLARLLAAIDLGLPVLPLHPRQTPAWHDALVTRTRAARIDALNPIAGEAPPGRQGDTLAYVPTSGSTGEPRIAVLSRRALVAAVAASASRLGWRDDDRWLLSLTFAHVGGLSVVLRCLAARRTLVLAGAGDDPAEVIERAQVTLCSYVPTQLSRLGRAPSSMRAVLVGGAAAPGDLVRSLRARGWPLLLTWGMTETCAQIATQPPGVAPDDLTSGPPLPGYQIRSVGGVLEVRTPSLLDGWLEGDAVRSPLSEGWLRTNDLGHVDEQGRVVVLGRADELLISGGENVSPASVEARLLSLDGVENAVVFGVPDDRWGQVVCAALHTSQPEALVRSQLASLSLPAFERPRRVALLSSFPLLPSGKVDRREVRRLAQPLLSPCVFGAA